MGGTGRRKGYGVGEGMTEGFLLNLYEYGPQAPPAKSDLNRIRYSAFSNSIHCLHFSHCSLNFLVSAYDIKVIWPTE